MLCFALSFVWFKVANRAYGPLTIIFFRLFISTVFLLVATLTTRQLVRLQRQDWRIFGLLGFFGPFLYFMFESQGLQRLTSTVAAVIISTIPLITPIAGRLFLGEQIRIRQLLGIGISFVGVSLVVVQWGLGFTASPAGVMLQFGAVCSAVAYGVILHKIPHRVNIMSVVFYQNLVATLYFLPFWLVWEMKSLLATPLDPSALVAIIKLSLFASTLAFMLFTYSMRRIGLIQANMFTNFIPVFTAIFAWFILGETLTLQKGIGMAIVIAGLLLAQIPFRRKSRMGTEPATLPSPPVGS